jgi:hypothetical protein
MYTNHYIGYEKTKTPSLYVQVEQLDTFPCNIKIVPGKIQYCTSKLNSEISGSHNNNFADYYLISNLMETCDGQYRAHSNYLNYFI